jgi:formylmethanofuran dehydrogenase subunit C
MTAINFLLKMGLRYRLDLSPLIPEKLTDMTGRDIAAIPLQYGNRTVPVADVFDVAIDPDGDGVRFLQGDPRFDYLGSGSSASTISVAGSVGAYAGYRLAGGTIIIEGHAGIFCGCEMRAGEIRVQGDAGDFVGGALPGNKRGMAGGSIMITGSAGDRVGDHMRRGLILIGGTAGDYVGSRMTAGTIAVQGAIGRCAGYAMKRGTLLLREPPRHVLATFSDCGTHTLGFLSLLLQSRAFRASALATQDGRTPRVRRYAGDQSVIGKGEILVIEN